MQSKLKKIKIQVLCTALILVVLAATVYMKPAIFSEHLPFLHQNDNTAPVLSNISITHENTPSKSDILNIAPQKNDAENLQNSQIKEIYDTQITLYRHYLSEVGALIINFLQDKSFSKQIVKIKALNLPKEIEDILSDFEEYDVKFLQHEINRDKVFPSSELLESFIKIEKDSEMLKEKKLLQNYIQNNLKLINSFFYSEELYQLFFTSAHINN